MSFFVYFFMNIRREVMYYMFFHNHFLNVTSLSRFYSNYVSQFLIRFW